MFLLLCTYSFHTSAQQRDFTLEQVTSYPFPNALTSGGENRIAWAVNALGKRNIYVAEGSDFEVRQLTNYQQDDGQELSSVILSPDGKWVVYIRGGDFGSNWDDARPVNPASQPVLPKVRLWSIPFDGGETILLGEGISPAISPDSKQVAFIKNDQVWTVPVDGSKEAEQLFYARGESESPVWSPDESMLAFTSDRDDHSYVGIFENRETPIQWIAPSFHFDSNPSWSPDGQSLAFIRQPIRAGKPDSILAAIPRPWSVMKAEVVSSKVASEEAASEEVEKLWESPHTMRGSAPTTQGRFNLNYADGHITFLSYHDGWPHLYSIDEQGGDPLLLTPGDYMAEYISLCPDKKSLVFTANTGPDEFDIDRRHIVKVSVDKADAQVMTPGKGNEWTPLITGDGESLIYLSAGAKRPPLPAVMNLASEEPDLIGEELIPADFPTDQLVVPEQVVFDAPDGKQIHASMFSTENGEGQKPAVIYVHGGPPRQMLLGWHYSSYYSNAYALNQYLASQGFVVLSVNYRLGIGYGYEFHRPVDGGSRGASEYQDVKAAGEWLAEQSFVDPDRIGIYGGSYGGYLTALALGRDSDLFAAGVDIHGVHNRVGGRYAFDAAEYEQAPDLQEAMDVAWQSSPVSAVDSWTSPVLIIHGDDDRNVNFHQSVDLVGRLMKKDVPMETIVIVDDTHHFMKYANQHKVNEAAAEYLIRKLGAVKSTP
ncbi:S9 family peptidase [Catalinimonas alkaloidigena]|uniref:S9 family peptidase n=1 Tax=Catalinimonas alkaloidigena TaxID=1075417 RepID=UPI0024057BDE|nr:prolyl oligopeptidase family serine peptidase [Catalinimonas alkaloidigena]